MIGHNPQRLKQEIICEREEKMGKMEEEEDEEGDDEEW